MTGSHRRTRLIAIVVMLVCFVAGTLLTQPTDRSPSPNPTPVPVLADDLRPFQGQSQMDAPYPASKTEKVPRFKPSGVTASSPGGVKSFANPATETLLGVPWSGEGLGRMVIADNNTKVDQLWVSTETGTLTGIQQGLIGCETPNNSNNEDTCYSSGTGGTIRADVYADDGTGSHLPTGSSLGWVQWADPMVNGQWHSVQNRNYNGYARPLMFSGCTAPQRMTGASLNVTGTPSGVAAGTMTCSGSAISVTRNTRYHVVWSNPSSSATTNWYGINFMTTRAKRFVNGATQQTAVLPADQWDVRYKATVGRYATGGTYRSCTLQGGEFQNNGLSDGFSGNHCYHPSMFFSSQLALLYGSGGASGQGYETLTGGDPTFGGTRSVHLAGVNGWTSAESWWQAVFPTTSTTVIGISASISVKYAGTMTAWVTDSAGTIVSPVLSRAIALAPSLTPNTPVLRPGTETDGLSCNPYPNPPPNNCTPNSYRVELLFPSAITLSAGTYRIWFGATSGEYALIGGYHQTEFPEGSKAKRSSPAVSASNVGDWDLFTYLIPSGGSSPTTTAGVTTTTTPGAPSATGDPAACAGGTRFQAESMTPVGGTFTVNTNYLTWTAGNPSQIQWVLPGTGDWTWRIRYKNTANARRLPHHSGLYTPALTLTNSSGAWTTLDFTMAAETQTYGRMYWDPSDYGATDLDYVDVCPGLTISSTTTTTAAPTTTTSTIVSPLVAVVNVPAANGLTVAPTDSGEVTVTPVSGCTVTGVQMFVDGTFRNTETGAPFNTFAWNNAVNGTITSGAHTFYGIATDSCGNSVTTATRSFIVASGTRVVTLSAFVDANSDGVRQATERIMRSTRWRLFDPAGVQIAGGKLETPSGTLTVPAASGWVVKWYPPLPATTPVVVTIPSSGAASVVVGGCCLNNI